MAKKYVELRNGKYWPNKEMKKIAWVSNPKIYKDSLKNPKKFWADIAKNGLTWFEPWKETYVEKLPYFEWFKGGKINFCYNCVDRHIEAGKGNKTALIWVPEPTNERPVKISYQNLHDEICKFSNVLKKYGVKKGDVVSIYMPLIPEALVAMLACTRIGAIHSVVFSAFAPDALKARIQDGQAKILVTADGYYRRGEKSELLKKAKKGAKGTTVKKIIVVPRLGSKLFGRKLLNYNKVMNKSHIQCKPEVMNSEDAMFLLYTSGTTGKPKGIVHDTGGYATQAYLTAKYNFNLHDDDVMWCTADIGWITGHTYAFYGPLLNGATTLIFEGSPDYPKKDRWWQIIAKNKVTVFYTAPTAIRMFRKWGDSWLKKHDLSSIRILGTVGEPIDKGAWMWYFKKIGGGRCPILDTWWQTETGGTLINSLPGIGPFVPTVAGRSFPGTSHIIVDDNGKEKKSGELGFLAQKSPFAPGLLHGVYKNHKKFVNTYWRFFKKNKKKLYDTSDGAFVRKDGLIRITGRTDDVMKVAGHRLSTAELENAINTHPKVNECAVVPMPDKIKGEVPIAFVVLKSGEPSPALEKALKKHVDNTIGPTARPARTFFVLDLPKTRSGKIMRRILKNIINNEEPKGLMTLVNPQTVSSITNLLRAG